MVRKSKVAKNKKKEDNKKAFSSFTAFYVTMCDVRERFGDVHDQYPDLVIIPTEYKEFIGSVSKGDKVLGMKVEYSDELESNEIEMFNEELNLGYEE